MLLFSMAILAKFLNGNSEVEVEPKQVKSEDWTS